MKTHILSTVALMLLAAACSTTAPRRQFDDIQLPTGLTYQPQRSVVIESPAVKAAQLVYRGRLEPQSLGDAMRTRLETAGWRPVSRTSTAKDGTVQVYEKDGNALEVHIYEGLWYTYLAISTSQTLQGVTAQANDAGQTRPSLATAKLDTSVDPPAALESRPAERPTRSGDPTFTQRVKDFFNNLLSW